ncbi:hypothetical protein ACLKA6_006457 [Drosophila palustris]
MASLGDTVASTSCLLCTLLMALTVALANRLIILSRVGQKHQTKTRPDCLSSAHKAATMLSFGYDALALKLELELAITYYRGDDSATSTPTCHAHLLIPWADIQAVFGICLR